VAEHLSRRDVEKKIVALAWKDDAFRRAFLADPKKQFEERLGTKLPAGLKISAHQEDDHSLHFVIPARLKTNVGELSDADLEKVAGGIDASMVATVVLGVGILVSAFASDVDAENRKAGQNSWIGE
jgi:hypothetical protein